MNTQITAEALFQVIGEQHVTIKILESKVVELTNKLSEAQKSTVETQPSIKE